MNRTQFFQALAHKGAGYELEISKNDAWAESRGGVDRFFDALTHSGPGYTPPSAEEFNEIRQSASASLKNLRLVMLENVEKALYAKGSLETAIKAANPKIGKEHADAARAAFSDFLQHLQEVETAISRAKETVNPLDLRTRFMLRRTERALRELLSQVEPFLRSLSDGEKRSGKFEHRSRRATREVERSIETFAHLVAAR